MLHSIIQYIVLNTLNNVMGYTLPHNLIEVLPVSFYSLMLEEQTETRSIINVIEENHRRPAEIKETHHVRLGLQHQPGLFFPLLPVVVFKGFSVTLPGHGAEQKALLNHEKHTVDKHSRIKYITQFNTYIIPASIT